MATIAARSVRMPLHPLHAIFLSIPLPLFLGGLLSDLAYSSTYVIQWSNFAQWLIAGGLVGGGLAFAWSVIDLVRSRSWGGRVLAYSLVLLAMWILGFINALVHSKDAWATMPAGLYLSIIVTLLALAASWIGFSRTYAGEKQ